MALVLKGKKIKELRESLGWNVTALAYHSDCREQTIERIEAGMKTTIKQANKIVAALNSDCHEIVTFEDIVDVY